MTFPVPSRTASFSQHSFFQRLSVGLWIQEHVKVLNALFLSLIFILVMGYIIQVNASISKGYEIRELENRIQELSVLNEKIELESRKAQSLDHVASSMKMLGFVKAQSPLYIDASEATYVLAK